MFEIQPHASATSTGATPEEPEQVHLPGAHRTCGYAVEPLVDALLDRYEGSRAVTFATSSALSACVSSAVALRSVFLSETRATV